jgi:hypothetical protein
MAKASAHTCCNHAALRAHDCCCHGEASQPAANLAVVDAGSVLQTPAVAAFAVSPVADLQRLAFGGQWLLPARVLAPPSSLLSHHTSLLL